MATREEILLTSIEALQASSRQLALEEERRTARTKGKLKATLQDEEAAAETEKKFTRLSVAASELGTQLRLAEVKGSDAGGRSTLDRPSSYATFYQPPLLTPILPDEDLIFDPFTDCFAYQETGFEPGPSGQIQSLEKHKETSPLTGSDRDNTVNGSKHTDQFLPFTSSERSQNSPGTEDAGRPQDLNDSTSHDNKHTTSHADQSERFKLGHVASLIESWMPPVLRGLVFQGASSSKPRESSVPDRHQ